MFGTNTLPVSWDGVFNGKQMEPGVYVYVIKVEYGGGRVQVYSGDVTSVR